MPQYRAFIISPDGEFQSSGPIECADDEVALKKQSNLLTVIMSSFGSSPER